MTPVIGPLTVVNFLALPIEQFTPAVALAIQVLARVNIARHLVKHPASVTLFVPFPGAFVDASVEVYDLTVALFDKLQVLAKVQISTGVHELAHAIDEPVFESTLVYDAISQQEPAGTVKFVIAEGPNVDVPILKPHLSVLSHVVLPSSCELTAILPRDSAVTLSFASFPVAFIGCLLVLAAVSHHKTIVVLHGPKTARSSVLENASELVPDLKVDDTSTKNDKNFPNLLVKSALGETTGDKLLFVAIKLR